MEESHQDLPICGAQSHPHAGLCQAKPSQRSPPLTLGSQLPDQLIYRAQSQIQNLLLSLASTQSGAPLLSPRCEARHRRSGCSSRGPKAGKGYCSCSRIDSQATSRVPQSQSESAKLNVSSSTVPDWLIYQIGTGCPRRTAARGSARPNSKVISTLIPKAEQHRLLVLQ